MTWHVEPRMLQDYAGGIVDDAYAYSVEAHLLECEVCRGLLRTHADRKRLDSIWEGVIDRTAYAPNGRLERLLLRMGIKDHLARLLTATPSLHLSWFAGIALVLSFAVAAAYLSDRGFVFYLIIAPLLPLAGIAVAFGPGVDPTYEVGLAAPMRSFHLLLIRTTAVLATSGAMAFVTAIVMPQPAWAVVAWLLPAMGLALVSLAMSTWISPLKSAASVAVVWIAACVLGVGYASQSSTTLQDVFGGTGQSIVAVIAVGAAALVFKRRETFDGGGPR